MRLISGYRILCAAIVMGSYSRSLIIGSILGLIGIGICLAIEQRRRNMDRAPPSRQETQSAWAQNNNSGTVTNDPHSSSDLLKNKTAKQGNNLDLNTTKEIEDDVTILLRPISNLSMHDKSCPGLPRIGPTSVINLVILDDMRCLLEDTIENFDSDSTLCTELQSDMQIDDNPPKHSWIRKVLRHGQISKHNLSEETIKRPLIFSSASTMEEANISNMVSCEEQCNEPATVKSDASDFPGPNSNPQEGLQDQQKCFEPNVEAEVVNVSTSSEEETGRSDDSASSSTREETSDGLPELLSHKVEDNNSKVLMSSGLGDGIHFPISETTCSAQFVKNQLEETCSLQKVISSAPQIQRNSWQDTTLNIVNKDKTSPFKFRDNWPVLNSLPYSDLAAVPKKARMKDKDYSRLKKDQDEIQEHPKSNDKHRVQKLLALCLYGPNEPTYWAQTEEYYHLDDGSRMGKSNY